jgi:threonylcarbamoyladenosine tRNA methylthiotransferase MtaB
MEEKQSKRGKVAFVTLGCKLNFSESSALSREFEANGYERVSASSWADIYVINTCSVTEHADKKSRNLIRRLHSLNRDAVIAVTGCYAQLKPDEIMQIEGVDLVLGADQKQNLFMRVAELSNKQRDESPERLPAVFSCAISQLETIFPAYSSDDRTRSFLKVQDGCDYHCSYCTIPLARGKSRNLPVEDIVKEAGEISARGVKEVVLTGVNTGDFGRSTGESLFDLIKALEAVEGIERYRISSIEPNLITDEILNHVAMSSKFLPHFHIPLQSGSDRILALMKRRYNTKMFRERTETIRRLMPFGFIGVDLITGFPAEGEEEFEESCHFLEEIKPSFIHIFPYSRRDNTPAARYPGQVKESVKRERVDRLILMNKKFYEDFVNLNSGRREMVLFESTQKGGMMYGYTGNYIKVEQKYDKNLIGKIVEVIL